MFLNKNDTKVIVILGYFILGISLILFRKVDFFIEPRLWAEEGTLYFLNAYQNKSLSDFFHPHLGYYSLYNKISVYLSLLVDLKYVAFITTLMSAIVYLLLLHVLFIIKNIHFTIYKKIILILVIFLIPSGEIWLNTITSQFWFSLIVFFIILDENWNEYKYYYAGILFISGLTGVLSIFLFPILFFKLIKNYRKNKLLIVTIVITAFIQLILVYLSIQNLTEEITSVQGGNRFSDFEYLQTLKSLLGYYISYPFLGEYLYERKIVLYFFSVCILLISFIYILYTTKIQRVILLSFIIYTILTIVSSIGMNGGLRYAYVPNIMLITYLLFSLDTTNKYAKSLIILWLGISILTSIVEYDHKYKGFYNSNWPIWKDEIECKKHEIKIWPQEPYSWSLNLNEK